MTRNAVFSVLVFGAFGCFQVQGTAVTGAVFDESFLLSAGGTLILSPPPSFFSTATGINNSGQIVGVYYNGSLNGYLYSNSGFVTTPIEGSGINDAGVIVGGAVDTNGVLSYVDAAPGFIGVALGINDLGQIVGTYNGFYGYGRDGFLDTNGVTTTIDFPGAAINVLQGINDLGEIVGFYATTGFGPEQAFAYNNGVFTPINIPGSVSSSANGINDLGQIVGSFTDSSGVTHGFLDTNGVIKVIDVGFGGVTEANGIDNAGQIVGSFLPAPEPAALPVAASGLAAMAALKRRHARRRSG